MLPKRDSRPLNFVNVSFKKAHYGRYKKPEDKCSYALIAEDKWVDSSLDLNTFVIKKSIEINSNNVVVDHV